MTTVRKRKQKTCDLTEVVPNHTEEKLTLYIAQNAVLLKALTNIQAETTDPKSKEIATAALTETPSKTLLLLNKLLAALEDAKNCIVSFPSFRSDITLRIINFSLSKWREHMRGVDKS